MKQAPAGSEASSAQKAGRGRPPKTNKEPVGIQAVDIALNILQVLAERPGSMGLSDLSRATQLQPSKLHRYLVSFARHGLLRQSPVSGEYDFGPLARKIGTAAFNRHHGLSVVHEALTSLSAETGCAVALYVWTDLGPTLMRMELGTQVQNVVLREGTALPLCSSATGRVFLAHMAASVSKPFIKDEVALAVAEGRPTWSQERLEREIEKIRAARVYWTSEAILPASLAVAPIFDAAGKLHSVFVVILRRGQTKKPEVQRLQQQIEHRLDLLARELV